MDYNSKKFKNIVLFLAYNAGLDVGKKKLAKLLYFIDFTLYELRKKSLTGMKYTKMDYGPMPEPNVFYPALDKLVNEGFIEIGKSEKPGLDKLEKIVPHGQPDMSVFDEDERGIIEQITAQYKLENGGSLERIAQSEPPYKMVKYGERVPLHLAFYRNSFGEMDLDD